MKVNKVEKARKEIPHAGIKIGDTYYWWKFRRGGKQFSKTYPKRSQLTQSGFLSQLYDVQDTISALSASDPCDLESMVDDIKSNLENMRDDCQSSLDNMPEHLQESSSSGQLLTERIEGLDSAISELEDVDLDYDEPSDEELEDEAKDELATEIQEEMQKLQDEELDDDTAEELAQKNLQSEIDAIVERLKEEKMQEFVNEKIEEIQNISFDF